MVLRVLNIDGMTAFFYKPDKHSTGGVGFQFFFLHCNNLLGLSLGGTLKGA
jgi:hypothetical protein